MEIENLIDLYSKDVFRFCYKLCQNKENAEDLYSQTFLKVLEKTFFINFNKNPKSFLFSIAFGIYKNNLKKQKRRQEILPQTNIMEIEEINLKSDFNTENQILDLNEKEILKKLINNLEDKFKIPIILFYFFDMPLNDISKVLKLPLGTVKSRLNRAKKHLKIKLEEENYER